MKFLHEFDELLTNLGVVIWGLGHDDFVFFEGALHLVVHQVSEYLLHLVHVLNSAANNRVLHIEELFL
mgnify:FL=1